MRDDREQDGAEAEPPEYRVYGGRSGRREPPPGRARAPRGGASEDVPYTVYRSRPPGLLARLRGEEQEAFGAPAGDGPRRPRGPRRRGLRGPFTWRRALAYLAVAVVGWLALSLVLFLVSAQIEQGAVPQSARDALASGGNMVTSAATILVVGTDQRPPGSKEPGANTSDKGSRSDTLMLWRVGGGHSARLSIPRDLVAPIPGVAGSYKINAAYAFGGPALTIKTVDQFLGIKINHLILVNFVNFPDFINALGGIDVRTGRICSDISGGARNGGFSLYLHTGVHHLDGKQALTLARTRHNKCDPRDSDLTRVKRQQAILNAIKSQLLSPGTFFRLPWVSWTAPKAIHTDMGGFSLLSLFVGNVTSGSPPPAVLKPTGGVRLADGESALTISDAAKQAAVQKFLNG